MIFDCSKLHTNLCEFAAHRFKLTQADQRRPKMQSLHRILFKPSCTSTKKAYTFPSTIWFQAYFWLKLLSYSLFLLLFIVNARSSKVSSWMTQRKQQKLLGFGPRWQALKHVDRSFLDAVQHPTLPQQVQYILPVWALELAARETADPTQSLTRESCP